MSRGIWQVRAESRLSLRVRVNGSYADKVELVPNNHVFDAAQ
jgi:hypothetical protein